MQKKVLALLLVLCSFCILYITGFAEESNSHEKLLEYVPYAAYTGQTETIETQGVNQCILRIFYKELKQQGLIPADMKSIDREPAKEAISSFPQVSVEDVCKTFDRLFGPNASRLLKIDEAESGKPILDSMSERLYLSEDKKTFYYVPLSYGGGDYTLPYGRLFRSEVVGEDLCLYVRMVYTSFDNDLYFWLFETFKREKALIDYRCDDWDKLGVNPWEMLDNGELDEYLPVYKHTFKPNGDGTYYWAQTELETAGKEIPLSVIKPAKEDNTNTSTQGSTNTNTTTDTTSDVTTSEVVSDTSTDTATDVSTNTTTDAVTDVSTGSATDAVPQEESSSAVWIVVAVVAVAAVAAAAVFFVLKKKKA